MAGKNCYACRKLLPLDAFATDKTKSDERKSICRACDTEKARKYYAANRARVLTRIANRRAATN